MTLKLKELLLIFRIKGFFIRLLKCAVMIICLLVGCSLQLWTENKLYSIHYCLICSPNSLTLSLHFWHISLGEKLIGTVCISYKDFFSQNNIKYVLAYLVPLTACTILFLAPKQLALKYIV